MYDTNSFIIMPIPCDRFTDVCALLGGAALAAVASSGAGNGSGPANGESGKPSLDTSSKSNPEVTGSADTTATAGQPAPSSDVTGTAGDDSGEIDAHGHPWSADLHASTKGKTKDGLWRMKVGVSRPDPLPGFPVADNTSSPATGTSSDTGTNSATSAAATDQASGQPATPTPEAGEDDEFAAFRAASEASNATDQAAAAGVAPRNFSDADLGALCNQAAVKLGDPAPIKEIISKFVPEGQVAHSRNIPADQRDNFAKEVEAKAGIQFAG